MVMVDSPCAVLTNELGTGEHLLWNGMPGQGLRLRASDTFAIPFSLMWGGFAFFWEYSVTKEANAPLFFDLWGIPFCLIGIYIIAGRFLVDRYRRSKTIYGLTNHRILIVSGRKTRTLALPLRNEISLNENSDGTGTILFGPDLDPYGFRRNNMTGFGGSPMVPSFEFIDGARQVYNMIKEAQRTATLP